MLVFHIHIFAFLCYFVQGELSLLELINLVNTKVTEATKPEIIYVTFPLNSLLLEIDFILSQQPDASCDDNHVLCPFWQASGFCVQRGNKLNPQQINYVVANCKGSCGKKIKCTNIYKPYVKDAPCMDILNNCPTKSKCSIGKTASLCEKTCGICL